VFSVRHYTIIGIFSVTIIGIVLVFFLNPANWLLYSNQCLFYSLIYSLGLVTVQTAQFSATQNWCNKPSNLRVSHTIALMALIALRAYRRTQHCAEGICWSTRFCSFLSHDSVYLKMTVDNQHVIYNTYITKSTMITKSQWCMSRGSKCYLGLASMFECLDVMALVSSLLTLRYHYP